jgi:hypothetical protein
MRPSAASSAAVNIFVAIFGFLVLSAVRGCRVESAISPSMIERDGCGDDAGADQPSEYTHVVGAVGIEPTTS